MQQITICPGCGKEIDPTPKAGKYRGGRYRKYHNDACRKRAARYNHQYHQPTLQTENSENEIEVTVSLRKRTIQENGREKQLGESPSRIAKAKKPKAQFWVFDWQAEYFGPMLERDADRVAQMVQGQMFEALDYSQASALYRHFLATNQGLIWLNQFLRK